MDVGGSFNRALERFKPHAVTLVIGMIAMWVINFVLTIVPSIVINAVLSGGILAMILTSLVAAAVSMVLTGPLWGGILTMIGKAYMGAKPELSDLAIATKNGRLNEYLRVGALLGSPALLGIIPFVGGLLALPVQIVVWFLFFPALIMVAEGSDAKSAIARSKELTQANAKTFGITYVVGGLVSIFVITAPIGLLMIMDTYFSSKGGAQGGGIQPMQGGGYDPNQQYAQQQQQQYQQGGYPPGGGGYPPG